MYTGSRRLLGYHVKPKDKSVLIYSRDALAKPLRELGAVLAAIRVGRFLPDADRSGRFREEAPDVVLPVGSGTADTPGFVDPPLADTAHDEGEHTGSEESSSSSSSVSSTASPAKFVDEVVYVANTRAKVVHVEAGNGVLACGRPYPRSFAVSRDMPEGLIACRRCFKSS